MLLVTAVLMLSIATNAIALSLCPHMGRSGAGCPMEKTRVTAEVRVESATPAEAAETAHCHSMTSSRHMDGMATSDMQEADVQPRSEESVAEINLKTERASDFSEISANAKALTQPGGDCERCMMHAQNIPAVTFRSAIQSGDSQHSAAIESVAQPFRSSLPVLSILDLHDHGPPGTGGARHLLISVFRI